MHEEVGDTDGFDHAFFIKTFKGAPCTDIDTLPSQRIALGARPMDKVTIEIIQAKAADRFVECAKHGIISAIGCPTLT